MKEDNVIQLGEAIKKNELWAVLSSTSHASYRSIYPSYKEAFEFAKIMCLTYYDVYIAKITEQVKLKEDYTESIIL